MDTDFLSEDRTPFPLGGAGGRLLLYPFQSVRSVVKDKSHLRDLRDLRDKIIRVYPCLSVIKDKSHLRDLRDLRDKKIIRVNPCKSVVKDKRSSA